MFALAVTLALAQAPVATLSLKQAFPEVLATREQLDAESRRQLLVEAHVLSTATGKSTRERRWLDEEKARLARAYSEAVGQRLRFEEVLERTKTRDVTLEPFWTEWVNEQLRLARLFPKPTSEIFPLSESDLTGNELAEWQFILTFDDGPTAPTGATDVTVNMLRHERLPAVFFVSGDRFEGRGDVLELYEHFIVGSHGLHHVPHVTLEARHSVDSVRKRLSAVGRRTFDSSLFRPPYGQRSEEFAKWLRGQGIRSVLWNIDSQDWRTEATADLVAGRVLALMLAKRRGVILFHDVHPLAAEAIPLILPRLGAAPVKWTDTTGVD